MAGDEKKEVGEVKTSIDALLDLIKSRGLVDVSVAASELGIAGAVAEQWAKVLEENNLVKISYRVGKMYVEPVAVSPGDRLIEGFRDPDRLFFAGVQWHPERMPSEDPLSRDLRTAFLDSCRKSRELRNPRSNR